MQVEISTEAYDLHPGHARKVLPLGRGDGLTERGVMAAAGFDPSLRAALEIRPRNPDGARRGQLGHRVLDLHGVELRDDHAHATAHIHEAGIHRWARPSIEHQARRIGLTADIERVYLERGLAFSDGGANLQHVRAENALLPLDQMIRVV